MRTTSRKLKKLIEEEEKTLARIEEQQELLKKIRDARKQEEDLVIIRSIGSMKLGARELLDLLTAIQEGNLSTEMREKLLAGPEEESDPDEEGTGSSLPDRSEINKGSEDMTPDIKDGVKDTPEREENDDAE